MYTQIKTPTQDLRFFWLVFLFIIFFSMPNETKVGEFHLGHKREATGGGGRLNAATWRDMPERERIGDRETMHSMNMGSPIEKLHCDAEFPWIVILVIQHAWRSHNDLGWDSSDRACHHFEWLSANRIYYIKFCSFYRCYMIYYICFSVVHHFMGAPKSRSMIGSRVFPIHVWLWYLSHRWHKWRFNKIFRAKSVKHKA